MTDFLQKTMPQAIAWNAVDLRWSVRYEYRQTRSVQISEATYPDLVFRGRIETFADCLACYRRFILTQADHYLTPWLQRLAQECGLPFTGVSYGYQKTLWGSCSSQRHIRLNAKLLYLPSSVVRYVLVHELCHTRHMHHQGDFWALVGEFLPDFKELRRLLRYGDRYIPPILNGIQCKESTN